ncbi:hypothetical protein EH164_10985 [Kosakonia sp. CCTCC M2018092]|uniref:hypothetical protein n=1 Tax=Kosakonia sp. CCTCC M2018092 TaxID=2492396 RepID=UPI000F60F777|nr:hypothetical protein [Kosakonia sp. CCTCC M2018092]AZI87548.1 hypothetical protein EH164_10985 [Kosakonia sp. CCTCC M2018092]
MEKYSEREIEELNNIAGCIIAAGIALQQVTTNKRIYITEKLNEALGFLHDWGYSIKLEEIDSNTHKLPDYLLIENDSGTAAFKMQEGSGFVTRWYHHFTSY